LHILSICQEIRVICSLENRRRDKMGTVEGFEHAYEDDLTDKMVRIAELHILSICQEMKINFRDRVTHHFISQVILIG
jgi:hypothetical protein